MKQSINDSIKGEGGIASMHHAIESKWPNADWFNVDNSYENMTWEDENDIPKPSEAEIQAEIDRLQAEYDAQEYARNRKAEYPDYGTQLNKIYDDGLTKWKTEMVDPIKAKYPKPE